MIDVFLSFDTEDPIHPESDDALLRLCQTLTDAGCQGNFFIVAEKARLLRERGRADVLAALAEHEIDYHGNWWFEFPECAMVYGELPWDQAVARATEIELDGIHDVAEICGAWPAAWVQHQNNVAAMMPHAMRRMGLRAWNGGFGSGPLRGWLMDQAVLTRNAHVMSLQGSWGGWERDPLRPDRVPTKVMDPAAELNEFCRRFDQVAAAHGAVVPLGHPTCWAVAEWWGWYEWDSLCHYDTPNRYPRSRQWRREALRSAADREAHFAWTQQAVEWLAGRSDVRVTTFGEFARRFAEPSLIWLDLSQVDQVAAACLDRPSHLAVGATTVSAADACGLLVSAIAAICRQERLPERVAVIRLLGPVEEPPPAAETTMTGGDLCNLALTVCDEMVERRRLPARLRSRRHVSLATACLLWARLWQAWRRDGALPATVTAPAVDLPLAADLEFFGAPVSSSSHAPPGFQAATLAPRVRQQSWSYRPFAGEG